MGLMGKFFIRSLFAYTGYALPVMIVYWTSIWWNNHEFGRQRGYHLALAARTIDPQVHEELHRLGRKYEYESGVPEKDKRDPDLGPAGRIRRIY